MRLSLSLLRRVAAACLLAVLAAVPLILSAHEIPNDVTMHAFVRVEGSQVKLYVRVPLIAIRDIIIPQKDADNIDLSRADSQLHDAATLWVGDDVKMFENERMLEGQQVLAVRATPVEDRSFDTFDAANLLLSTPQRQVDVAVKTGYLDILFGYPVQSADSHFSIDPKWARLGVRTLTTVRFVLADGTIRAFELEGNPGLVRLDPTIWQSMQRFLTLGFRHVLVDDTDHILFILCLIVPFRRFRSVVTMLLSFAAAYTLTLVAGAYGMVRTHCGLKIAHRSAGGGVHSLRRDRQHRRAPSAPPLDHDLCARPHSRLRFCLRRPALVAVSAGQRPAPANAFGLGNVTSG
ncbi:MAG: HupE/UreJ family protein [Vicinamibacterales bacterium]